MTSHAHLISKFGGSGPLAKSIGVEPKLAIHWPKRGIPARYWHRVVEAAATIEPPLEVSAHLLERLPAEDKVQTEAA